MKSINNFIHADIFFCSLEFFGALWSSLEFFGVLWSSLELFGALWSSLELLKISSILTTSNIIGLCKDFAYRLFEMKTYLIDQLILIIIIIFIILVCFFFLFYFFYCYN